MENIEASLRPKIEEAVKVVAETGRDKFWLNEELMLKNWDRRGLVSLRYLDEWKEKLKHSVIHGRKKIDLLELLLHKLRFTDNAYQKKPIAACLLAPEIKNHNLHFWMAHDCKSLAAEKRLLKEIKESLKEEKKEDSEVTFASYYPRCEADIRYFHQHMTVLTENAYINRGRYPGYLHGDELMLWLQHQMPILISEVDTKDPGEDVRCLQCRIERCGVILLKKADKKPTADYATPTLVKEKTFSVSKKALQEQIKLSRTKIEESKKTILALSGQVAQAQRNLVSVEEEMTSLQKKFPGIAQRKNEAHGCIFEIITKK